MTDWPEPPDVFDLPWVVTPDGDQWLVQAHWSQTGGEHPGVYHMTAAVCVTQDVAEGMVRRHNTAPPPSGTLAQDLARVLDQHSMENASNTPDFLLAEYLERCLAAAEILINRRDAWHGVTPTVTQEEPS
jgi:hypothetical protein